MPSSKPPKTYKSYEERKNIKEIVYLSVIPYTFSFIFGRFAYCIYQKHFNELS